MEYDDDCGGGRQHLPIDELPELTLTLEEGESRLIAEEGIYHTEEWTINGNPSTQAEAVELYLSV